MEILTMRAKSYSRVWLCDSMDCGPPGSSVHSSRSKSTRMDYHTLLLLQGIFPTQGSNPLLWLLNCRQIFFTNEPAGKPRYSLYMCLINKRECTAHSKHPLPTTQETTLHMDIMRWSILKSHWLYSLQPKMEKLYTVNKTKTGSRLWLKSWTLYCQIQT